MGMVNLGVSAADGESARRIVAGHSRAVVGPSPFLHSCCNFTHIRTVVRAEGSV